MIARACKAARTGCGLAPCGGTGANRGHLVGDQHNPEHRIVHGFDHVSGRVGVELGDAGHLALALDRGSQMQAPLGRAVIGGLAMSTFATLLVLPSVFAIVTGKRTA